jgi:hypothetical protein
LGEVGILHGVWSESSKAMIGLKRDLIEALCKTHLAPNESKLFWVIFHKPGRITYSTMEKMTGIKRWHIARSLDGLQQRNIVISERTGHKVSYNIQGNTDIWENRNSVRKSLPVTVLETAKKMIPKQVIDEQCKDVFLSWNARGIVVHEEMTPNIELSIKRKLDYFSADQIIQSINNYADVLVAGTVKARWNLIDFLNRKHGIEQFMRVNG